MTKEKMAKYFCEFIGTAYLVLFIKLAVPSGSPATALVIGLGLGIWIFNTGHISGGMHNPSVTMAVMARNIPGSGFQLRSDYWHIFMYLLCQYLGGIVGGLCAWVIGGEESAAVYPTVFQLPAHYDDGFRLFQAFFGEFLFTFLLTSTVIYTATDKRVSGNNYFGMQIGLTLSVSIVCIGRISGSAINSAVWLGCVIPAIATGQVQHNLSDAWIYWVATLLAGLVSGLLFNLLNGDAAAVQKKPESPDGHEQTDTVEMRTFSKGKTDQYTEVSAANID